MNKQSDEFDKSKEDDDIPNIVRKAFRVPVDDSSEVWAVIDHERYPVLDIAFDGIKIALRDEEQLVQQQVIKDCELNIFDVSFKGINGRVVHISLTENNEWQCGIHWIDITEDTARQIFEIVSKLKDKLLKDDGI